MEEFGVMLIKKIKTENSPKGWHVGTTRMNTGLAGATLILRVGTGWHYPRGSSAEGGNLVIKILFPWTLVPLRGTCIT